MAINPDIRDQAYQFFIAEAPELLQTIETGLLTLRHDRSIPKVHELMRAAHSLKGGAASVELEAIATLAHRLENIFKALYSETVEIDTDLENQLLQAYDCLSLPLKSQVATGHFEAEQALANAAPIFDQIEGRLGDALAQTDSYIPSSAELGVNLAASIFEVDVAEGLERLAAVVADPQDYEVAGELRAQVEVFAGFAEFLNLPGFGAIAHAAQQALDTYPERALEITQLALADFELSKQAVLAGDSIQGGNPSAALLALADSEPATLPVMPMIEAVAETEWAIAQSESTIPWLETIFEANPDTAPFDLEAIPVAESPVMIPSLEPVLGSIIDGELVSEVTNLEEDEEELEPSLSSEIAETSEISERPERVEVTLESLDQLFESLVPIQDISALTSPLNSVGATSEKDKLVSAKLGESEIPVDSSTSNNQRASVSATNRQKVAASTPALSVRVDLDRLERMNNLVGELAINRNGLSLQNQQLQGSVRELLNRFSRFQNIVNYLQDLSDQMLVTVSSSGVMGSRSGFLSVVGNQWSGGSRIPHWIMDNGQRTTDKSDFDSLEMDSYGIVHSRIQEILEELVQLEEAVEDIVLFAKKSDRTLEQQRQMLTHLRDELMWARMLPIGEVLNRFPRMLRELSTTYHKRVNLKLYGTGVLVDKAVLEKLYDPLLHLLRNAFDHGIESPEIRRQQGKSEQGEIEIRAYHKGSQTIIEVKDDGQGLNSERIGRRAVELGLLSPQQLAMTSNNRLWELIFEPGFSTAHQVSELSGRGVGLDVARLQLRSLKGTISVSSSPGVGTTFTLRLPLTLTIAKLLVCFIGSTAIAVPSDSIEELVIPKENQVKQSGIQRFLHWRGQLVPTHRLSDLLEYACPLSESSPSKVLVAVPSPEQWALPMLILRQEQKVFALEVDRLVTEQELVIKPFGSAIAPPSYAYGCTILGDGSLIPVIDGTTLLEFAEGQTTTPSQVGFDLDSEVGSGASRATVPIRTAQAPTILIVDDAAALRQTLALTLERAGFRVLQARDGREAIEQLQQSTSVQLVVCDIEMPNMNGFEFLSQRRQDPQLSQVPVAMLTSRSSNKHRWLAMQLGASGYFTKPYLEQEFLRAIKDIIREHSPQSNLTSLRT